MAPVPQGGSGHIPRLPPVKLGSLTRQCRCLSAVIAGRSFEASGRDLPSPILGSEKSARQSIPGSQPGISPSEGQAPRASQSSPRSTRRSPNVAVMRYRTLGGTGIQVSAYCLGAMMLGEWGNKDHEDGVRIVHAALDAGINFIDTADVYSHGESEEIVGKALKGRHDEVVLATKVNFDMGPGKNNSGNSRRWIRYEVEQSLRRLGTDWIDLYQIHRPDPANRHRGDPVGPDGPDPRGQGPCDRLLDIPR